MRIRPWGQVHRLAISSLLGWALLLGLVTLLLSADAATLPALAQALPRAITRTLTAADFRLGMLQGLTMTTAGDGALRLAPDAPGHRGTYIAAPTSFDLPLTALAVRLDADIPRDTQLTIEVAHLGVHLLDRAVCHTVLQHHGPLGGGRVADGGDDCIAIMSDSDSPRAEMNTLTWLTWSPGRHNCQ